MCILKIEVGNNVVFGTKEDSGTLSKWKSNYVNYMLSN